MKPPWDEHELQLKHGVEDAAWLMGRMQHYISMCPTCKGTNEEIRNNFRIGCQKCGDMVERLTRFAMIYFPSVPFAYRHAKMSTLAPSDKSVISMERQQEVIDYIRANRDDGYAFFGPPSSSKTVLTTALYGDRLWRYVMMEEVPFGCVDRSKYFPINRIKTKQMLDEHTAWSIRDLNDDTIMEPKVSAKKITAVRNAGKMPRLFLEEVDKVKETEARRATLFEVLDALHEAKGQLVVNTNYTPLEFQQMFGDHLAWRINDMCTTVDFFERG